MQVPSSHQWLLLVLLARTTLAGDLSIHGPSEIRFATVNEAVTMLSSRDEFIDQLSRFDRQSRMKTDQEVSQTEFLRFVAQEAVAWQPEEVDRLTAMLPSIREKLDGYRLPLPKQITFIKTSGKEEGNAAYTRGDAIILPERMLSKSPRNLERLVLHELFHIISRHDSVLREQLYAIIGFHPCPTIRLPPTLADRKITNPDAPAVNCYIQLLANGKRLTLAPILFASVEQYEPQHGGSFFQHLRFRLILIRKQAGQWQAVEEDGQAVLLDPQKLASFSASIGKNTRYIIHPDEILADNFVLMVTRADRVPTPRILEAMRQSLSP